MATERNVVDFKIHNLTEEQFQELKAQGKIDPNAVYCTPDESLKTDQITNCITEIPQNIKLELANGVLTLKAGSTYYTPNGVDTYTKTTTTADKTLTNTNNNQWAVFINQAGNLQVWQTRALYSGTTAPSGVSYPMWWDTTNNIIKISNDSGATWVQQFSLPLCIITVSNGAISSIDQVFNGFGYIGSTIFVLPGVRGLIPNGRNEDGTLKNTAINCQIVKTTTLTSAYSATLVAYNNGTLGAWSTIQYDPVKNITYNNSTPKANVAMIGKCAFGEGGRVTLFEPNQPFHAVDYNDTDFIAHQAMPSSRYQTLTMPENMGMLTMPEDGYIYASKAVGQQNVYLSLSNLSAQMSVRTSTESDARALEVYMPVSKGDTIQFWFNSTANGTVHFIYANGAK